MFRRAVAVLIVTFMAVAAAPAARAEGCGPRSSQGAMWWSILHPGVGEWYLRGFGPLRKAPQRKFWLGFIPVYGWPGYLQVKSAIDAQKCRTNDDLTFNGE
ncbi:MAG TPA: hypothetical protein VMR50_14570 [Myxococcota bacterium]|nr:hypothetical protein [Myxococcota bacterium]